MRPLILGKWQPPFFGHKLHHVTNYRTLEIRPALYITTDASSRSPTCAQGRPRPTADPQAPEAHALALLFPPGPSRLLPDG